MPKSILLIALSFSLYLSVNSAALSAVSPLPLLVEQCLQLQPPEPVLISSPNPLRDIEDAVAKSRALEASMLGLFNVKDRLRYYKSMAISPKYQESLLQCQLHLADLMAETLASPALAQLLSFNNQENQDNQELLQLSLRWSDLVDDNANLPHKSQLHTSQAAVKLGLRSQALTLQFGNTHCDINQGKETKAVLQTKSKSFDKNIAAYLIQQKDSRCQQLVWNAYQGRAREKNAEALTRIARLRNESAAQAGFRDHTGYSLSKQFLSKPELVKAYLDSVTRRVDSPPWQFGTSLSQSRITEVAPLDSVSMLTRLYKAAEPLGFHVEIVTDNIHRVWHRRRLLGDIFLGEAPYIRAQTLRFPVVGNQFGQMQISSKPLLNSYREQQALIKATATVLATLSSSSHHYLINALGETGDTSKLGRLWLEYYLTDAISLSLDDNSREQKLASYGRQLKVFRAKVALNFYSDTEPTLYPNLSDEFIRAFGQAWSESQNYAYNFFAIAEEGPIYYQDVWQESLANFVYQTTKNCQEQYKVFDILMINEPSSRLEQRLETLLGSPIDANSLIKRIHDATLPKNQRPITCSL
ncbi:response regulator receiver protein [Shewanella sediminis HAW-EB3]|uniref:Response regulator receiver protein n=1 Tax=Shewanella sediminis (strain HAW-EB3) TaxID=425104 RepID=A8FUV9_SHESH|nr:transcriptional regulator [Shewanella sediminis]ABV36632.1 response regulator receiver protein [Shewanella sediminis HAW-EB3]